MSLKPILIHPAAFDPDADAREQIEIAHELTCFHRATMARRSRRIGQFLHDPKTITAAAALRAPTQSDRIFPLPETQAPDISLADLLSARTSARRDDLAEPVRLEVLAGLLTLAARANRVVPAPAAPTAVFHFRPYPSAGGLYPCEIYVIPDGIEGLEARPYRYDARLHALVDYGAGPALFATADTAGKSAPCAIVITGVPERSMAKYGPRGYRFSLLEAGHLSQNLLLAAAAHQLPALTYGSYYDRDLEAMIGIDGITEIVLSTILLGGKKDLLGGNSECIEKGEGS